MIRIAVLGLGLIGGSIALGARRRLGAEIVGVDLARVVGSAPAREVADELVSVEDEVAVAAALRNAELAVLAAPVRVIKAQVGVALRHANLVTDVGSTKRQIVAVAQATGRQGRFVPGHPMAGASEGGLAQARSDLFEGRYWILCPELCDDDALPSVEELVRGLGAHLISLSAAEHDQLVAMASHVPQLLASVLGSLGPEWGAEAAPGPAYQGITRTAGGDPSVWLDIYASNADQVARALRQFIGELERIACALERTPADLEPVAGLLERARSTHRR